MNIGSVIDLDLTSGGYAPQSARDRKIADGSQFDKYFTEPNKSKDCKKRDGSVEDTVSEMKVLIKTKSNQVRKLAREVLAITNVDGSLNIRATVNNIFNFIYKYIKYNLEKGEQLQSPRHLWWRAQKLARVKEKPTNSGDCDCMAIFAGSCMYQLGIPFALRIAGYSSNNYQHVYCIAYDGGIPIICDPVTNDFDYEKPPVIQKTYPISSEMLSGTDIYVLDGIDEDYSNIPIKGVYQEQPDGGLIQISGVGTLGKSKKRAAKKAARKQKKAEKKAVRKKKKIEKKAKKKEKKAEKKAQRKLKKAEKKAKKLERKAAKKGGKKAEKLLKKAAAKREAAQIKADAIRDKAKEKIENKLKRVDEKLKKKTAKIELKRLKQSGASKAEIKAAKKHLKEVKKEIRKARKEDGRGFFRKIGKGVKAATMLPVRAAFLMLMNLNFRGLASRLYENQEAYDKFLKKWKNVFGGKEAKLKIAITKGQAKKALFGSKKTNAKVAENADTSEVIEGIFGDFYLGALGVEPTTTTAAAAMAAASSALAALTKILKAMGVNVPESVEDAIEAGQDIAELLPDSPISEDPENWENPDEYNADTDGDGVISKKEARKAKKAAKKAAKAEKKAAKKAAKAEGKVAKKAARNSDDEDNNDNDEPKTNKMSNFLTKTGEFLKKTANVVTDITNATRDVAPPQVVQDQDSVYNVTPPQSQQTTSKGKKLAEESKQDSNWFKENPALATGLAIGGVVIIGGLIVALSKNNTPQATSSNNVAIQGIDLL